MEPLNGKSKIVVSAPGGCLTRLVRMLIALGVIAVILVLTAVFVVHSDGFRQLASDRLSAAAGGQEIRVDRARTGWPCDLVLEGVETPGVDEGGAGFRVAELRVGPRPGGGWRVRMRQAVLNLVETDEDGWRPACFAGIGDLPWNDISELTRLTRTNWPRGTLRLTDTTLRWLRADGGVRASAAGVLFSLQPVRVEGRSLCLYRLQSHLMAMPDGTVLRDVNREWLASEGSDFIELGSVPEGTNAPRSPWR